MKGLGIALAIVVLCGCQSSTRHTDVEDLKRRLVGQTTGGREGTWKFRWVNAFFWNQPVGELQPFEEWVFERVYCLKLRTEPSADPMDIATADRVFYWRRVE